jgi:hypothetical protein
MTPYISYFRLIYNLKTKTTLTTNQLIAQEEFFTDYSTIYRVEISKGGLSQEPQQFYH